MSEELEPTEAEKKDTLRVNQTISLKLTLGDITRINKLKKATKNKTVTDRVTGEPRPYNNSDILRLALKEAVYNLC